MKELNNIDIKAIKRGDEKAFETAFHMYFEKICFFAKDYVFDWEVAREIAQESFIKLWEIKEDIKDDTNILSLLCTVTKNNALNYLKHETVKSKFHDYTIQKYNTTQLNIVALSNLTVDKIIAEEMKQQVDKAVEKLPERCRMVFILSRNFELTYKEIAEQLNISVNTVENHIAEALKRIRGQLNSNY